MLALLSAVGAGCNPACAASPPPDLASSLTLPPGFTIEVLTKEVPNARAMAMGPKGTLFVGSRDQGKVYAVRFSAPHQVRDVVVIASGLQQPAGVDLWEGDLYVSAIDRILRYDDIEARLDNPPKPVVVTSAFPDETHHGWKFIRFGPDGLLYVPVGAPCNVCVREEPIFASITRIKPDGTGREIIAHGVRNTVGFDWHPVTKKLWFTENGRDWLGDERPPDELNRLDEVGQHFGFPFCHGTNIADPEFGKQRACATTTPPVQTLGPHVAALGMRFYTGKQFPRRYHNAIFIAEHGSWNRTRPLGYRITVVTLDGEKATSYEPFASGWLEKSGRAWGRPVDVLVHPDGSLYVSDDRAGWIYRVAHSGGEPTKPGP